jgi:hypothetical protein
MSDVMSCDDKGRHYDMQNDWKNWGKMGGFVTQMTLWMQFPHLRMAQRRDRMMKQCN